MKITIDVEDLAVLSYLSGVTEQVETGEGSEKAENWEASYLAQVAYRATLEGQIRDLKAEVLKYKNSARFLK